MNNYYTLIYLIEELNGNILGGEFQFAISPHKDVLECYIETDGQKFRLVFSANPSEIVLFLDEYRPPKKQNVLYFFDSLKGQKITDISLATYDRLAFLDFSDGSRLHFKLFGNDANALLIKEHQIIDAFKHPESIKGDAPPQPQQPNFNQKITGKAKARNELTKLNPVLPRNLLPRLIEQHKVGDMSVEETKKFAQKITRALENDPHPRVLKTGDLCLWSADILDVENDKTFKKVNDTVRYAYRNAVHLRRLHKKKQRLVDFLERAVAKKKAQHRELQQADKSLERADTYEKYAHILMANAHQTLQGGAESIELADIYEESTSIEIAIKQNLSIPENAERYYDKAKSSRTSYEKAKQRLPKVKRQLDDAESLLDELEGIDRLYNLEQWMEDHSSQLERFGYGTENDGQAVSPFRKFKVGKYEIWIGKNAKSNDKLTQHAHKEDIWLHARGVGGSHTVIRMGNEQSYQPKNVILHAAAYAAWYSKARGMESAPVMYTKRKYVYKPSGAAPGAVVLKREEVVMVPPAKPE